MNAKECKKRAERIVSAWRKNSNGSDDMLRQLISNAIGSAVGETLARVYREITEFADKICGE